MGKKIISPKAAKISPRKAKSAGGGLKSRRGTKKF